MNAIVIGSGMAGLTAALYLLRAGHGVRIFEQAPVAGGVTAPLRSGGYTWDLGQLLLEGLGPGEQVGEILAELGIDERIERVRDQRAYVFPDFRLSKPDDYAGPFWRKEELKALFPDESDGIERYYRFYRRMMEVTTLAGLAERSRAPAAGLRKAHMAAKLLPLLPGRGWNAQRWLERFFRSKRLQAVFTSILADFVVRPSEFPGLGLPAVNPEPAFDRDLPLELSRWGRQPSYHYIRGGVGALTAVLRDEILAAGGEILTSKAIRRIRVEGGEARGVECEDGERADGDCVLASGGARESLVRLAGREHFDAGFLAKVDALPLMESAFMVHLGIDFDPTPHRRVATTYYYGTYDIERGVEEIQRGRYHEGRDGFVLYVPSRHSPEMAPPGHHALTLYTVAPNVLDTGTWNERREALADTLLEHAERFVPGIREHTRVRIVLTPEDFRKRTHLAHHAFGGVRPVMGTSGLPHATPIRGLYFIGAQSESGGGVNNVVHGAWRTIRHIRRHRSN
jgi:all-trans-retinol 13,14-reductase